MPAEGEPSRRRRQYESHIANFCRTTVMLRQRRAGAIKNEYSPEEKERIKGAVLQHLLEFGLVRLSVAASGIDHVTFTVWCREDPDFKQAVADANAYCQELVESTVYQAALDGDINAAKMWLAAVDPQKWRQRWEGRLNITDDTGPSDVLRTLGLLVGKAAADEGVKLPDPIDVDPPGYGGNGNGNGGNGNGHHP